MIKNEAATKATLETKEWEGELDDADLTAVSGGALPLVGGVVQTGSGLPVVGDVVKAGSGLPLVGDVVKLVS